MRGWLITVTHPTKGSRQFEVGYRLIRRADEAIENAKARLVRLPGWSQQDVDSLTITIQRKWRTATTPEGWAAEQALRDAEVIE